MSKEEDRDPLIPTEITMVSEKKTALLGERPLIKGESADEYDLLRDAIAEVIKPTNFIESMWVKDLADLGWELDRAKQVRTKLLEAWTMADAPSERQFSSEDEEVATAEGYRRALIKVKGLDQVIAMASARRDAVLRDVERRRFDIARRLKVESWSFDGPVNDDQPMSTTRSLPNPGRT
jgi:hypothetical protein